MARHRTLLDFAKRMDQMADNVPRAANMLAITVARAILKDLGYVTPIDTSTALSNWNVTIGAPSHSVRGAYYEGRKGSSKSASLQMVLALGDATLKTKQPGQTIWIVNNISYIGDLDNGYSPQFAGGFTTRARAIAERVVSRTGIKL